MVVNPWNFLSVFVGMPIKSKINGFLQIKSKDRVQERDAENSSGN